jgi:HD superfamily phosphohydrolase
LIAKSDSLHLKSSVDDRFGVSFSKSFLPSLKDTSLQITYELHNHTDSVVTYALWEVTRVQKDSKVFFTLEEQNSLRSIKESFWDLDSNLMKVCVSPTESLTNKMLANGKGWLIYQKNSLAIIKTFPDLSLDELPPNHNEIKIYKDNTKYLEVEQHSPYIQLDLGDTYQWQVHWYPRKFSNSL